MIALSRERADRRLRAAWLGHRFPAARAQIIHSVGYSRASPYHGTQRKGLDLARRHPAGRSGHVLGMTKLSERPLLGSTAGIRSSARVAQRTFAWRRGDRREASSSRSQVVVQTARACKRRSWPSFRLTSVSRTTGVSCCIARSLLVLLTSIDPNREGVSALCFSLISPYPEASPAQIWFPLLVSFPERARPRTVRRLVFPSQFQR